MATKYIDQRLTTGANDGSSPANAWRSIGKMAENAANVSSGDTVVFVENSGVYEEVFSTTTTHTSPILYAGAPSTDISFDGSNPAAPTISAPTTNLAYFNLPGAIIRVEGSPNNSRQFTVVSATFATPDVITLEGSNKIVTEAAGVPIRISLVSGLNNVTGASIVLPTMADGINWVVSSGVELSAGLRFNSAKHKWNKSAVGNLYYLTMQDGSNPSMPYLTAATVNGKYYTSSAGDLDHSIAYTIPAWSAATAYTKGKVATSGGTIYACISNTTNNVPPNATYWVSLPAAGNVVSLAAAADGVPGYGDVDSLGYPTIYLRWDAGTPTSVLLTMGCAHAVINTSNINGTITGPGKLSFGSTDQFLNGAGNGGDTWRTTAASGTWGISRLVMEYATYNGPRNAGAGTVIAEGNVTYWNGHRGYVNSSTGTLRIFGCTDYSAHLFALISSTGHTEIKNCIGYNNEAGSIDKSSAGSTLDEDYNCWYPRMTASGGALGYISTANWTTTGAHSYPPSAATTIATQANIVAAGGVDPNFVATSDTAYSSCDFNLANTSVLFRKGANGKGYLYKSIDETSAHSAVDQNIGAYATRRTNLVQTRSARA